MKFFDNFFGKIVLTVLALLVVTGILLPGVQATVGWATTWHGWTIQDAAEYWESQGYVAYASPDGTLYVYDIEPNADNTYDIGTAVKRFQKIYGMSVYVDGTLYVGSRAISDNGTQLKVDDTYISAPGTPDYTVGVNTATDDVPGSTGYWVKSGATGQIVETTTSTADVAINWPMNLGGHIHLGSGHFVVNSPVFFYQNYTTLDGEGDSTWIDLASGSNCSVIDTQPALVYYCQLRNLSVNANKAGNTMNFNQAAVFFDCFVGKVENLAIYNSPSNGIRSSRSQHTIIRNNYVEASDGSGIRVDQYDSYGEVTGNHLVDCGVAGSVIALDVGNDKIVSGNTIVGGGGLSQIGCYTLTATNGARNIIEGNVLYNGLGMGIAYFQDTQVIGNLIVNVAQNAIDDAGGGGNLISGNRIDGVLAIGGTGCGISAGGNSTIESNTIEDCHEPGIWIDSQWDNQKIIGNTIIDCNPTVYYNTGILIVSLADKWPDNLVISGNRIYGTPTEYGIRHWTDNTTLSNAQITNNNLMGNAVAGLLLPYLGTNNIIRGNNGYVTENSGVATILINTGSIVVNHGLATTPTRVIVTMTSNPGLAVSTWADTYGTTSFTIHTSSNVTSATTFDWRAWVGEGN